MYFFKRPRSGQNIFTSRWLLAQRNDQGVNYKLCEYEIQASSLLSVLACWKCAILYKFHRPSWLIERYSNFPRFHKHRHARRARVIFLWTISLGDRSIHGAVYSTDLVDLTSFFGCDVQQERNWEFMMYIKCYIGNGKITK